MANNLIQVPVIRSVYTECDLKQASVFTIPSSSSSTFYKQYNTSSYSTSQLNFTLQPADNKTMVSRRIVLNVSFLITITGTVRSPQVNILDSYGLTTSPRCMPLSRSCKTASLTINDFTFTLPLNDMVTCFQRFGFDEYQKQMTISPVMTDQSNSYDELINTVRNPLGAYYNSIDGRVEPRGAFQIQVLTNTPTSASFIFNVSENIMLSPLHYCGPQQMAFCGVRSMTYTHVFDQNLFACLWSQAPSDGATYTTTTVAISGQPACYFAYYTSPELVSIPRGLVYEYSDVQRYLTDTTTVLAPGFSTVITSNNIQQNCIPSQIYVYARINYNQFNVNMTDSFLRINSISLSFGNASGLLSSMSPQQLYTDLHMLHGGDLSYNQFFGSINTNCPRQISGVGSILCIKPSINIGLNDVTNAVGMLANTQIQMNVNVTNIHPTLSFAPTLVIICITPGIATFLDNTTSVKTGVITSNEALNAGNNGSVTVQSVAEGGSFFTNLKHLTSQIPQYISKVIPVAEKAIGVAKMLGLGDEMEGEGRRRHRRGRGMEDENMDLDLEGEGRRKRRKRRGGALVTRNELKDLEY